MSTTDICIATQSILQSAVSGLASVPNVQLGIPKRLNDYLNVYLFTDGYTDDEKLAGGVVRRTHIIPIHLCVLVTGDDTQAEADFMIVSDLLSNALYTNRRLNGSAVDSHLLQRGGEMNSQSQFVLLDEGEYRHRWWTLHAAEDITFAFA